MLQIVISALPTYKVTAVKPENISNTQTCLLPFDPFNILLICVPILEEKSSTCSESSGADFEPCQSKGTPHLITQKNLNDLVRDLNLSKGKTKLLGSRLQQWNLLSPETKVNFYRQSLSQDVQPFFIMGQSINFSLFSGPKNYIYMKLSIK